jgi:flagellar basal-body rod protein FlgC
MSGFFKSMAISSSGLAAQRIRMNILSSNLANAETTRTEEGGPYKRKDVVFTSDALGNPFEDFLDGTFLTQLKKVKVTDIHEDQNDPKRIFEPNHPDADKNGYVEKPNIQVMSEMVNMIAATRAYEANATALNSAKDMAIKAIEIGR